MWFSRTRVSPSPRRQRSACLTIEQLEDRCLPAFLAPLVLPGAGLAPAAADFNLDGRMDLATINPSAGTVNVLLGNSDGSFQLPRSATAGTQPHSLLVADVNNDGKPDVVTANNDGTVSALPGRGDGTFLSPRKTSLPRNGSKAQAMNSLDVGDVNRDGKADLVLFANYSYSTGGKPSPFGGGFSITPYTFVLLGGGDGSFRVKSTFEAGSPVLGDFDRDGKLDLVTISHALGSELRRGFGDGTFSAPTALNVSGGLAADFDGDGKLDLLGLLPGYTTTDQVPVFLGNGDGTFQAARLSPLAGQATGFTVGDLNRDGVLDLITVDASTGTVRTMLGNGDGSFRSADNCIDGLASNLSRSAVLADFNGDGLPDLVVGNGSGDLALLLNDRHW